MPIALMCAIPSPSQQFTLITLAPRLSAASARHTSHHEDLAAPRASHPAQLVPAGAIGRPNLTAGGVRTADATTAATSTSSATGSPTTQHSSAGGSGGKAKEAARTKPLPLTEKEVRRHLQRTESLSPRRSLGCAGEALRVEGFEPAALPFHCVDTYLEGG